MIEIELGGKRGQKIGTAIIDDADAELAKHHWWMSKTGYARREEWIDWAKRKRRAIYLHREVAERKYGGPVALSVDHANRNKLDNRRENLSPRTQTEQQQNTGTVGRNTNAYRNVYADKRRGTWKVQVKTGGKALFGGYFADIEAAKDAAAAMRCRLGFYEGVAA